ncbi:hypothetical protein EON62_03270 [archaeon]|nr:MAG: hypothetical protein EON62_03270 [archaeon]
MASTPTLGRPRAREGTDENQLDNMEASEEVGKEEGRRVGLASDGSREVERTCHSLGDEGDEQDDVLVVLGQ